MRKTTTKIIILFILDAIIFGLCFYLFTYIKQIDNMVSSRLAQIESELKADESLRSIKILMNDTKKERERMSLVFIQPDDTVNFIETIESLGDLTGVKLEIDSVGVDNLKSKKTGSTELFRISLKTEGSWTNTIHFLTLLENVPHKISFENVNLSKVSDLNDGDKGLSYWNGNFNLSALKIKNYPKR